MNKFNKNWPTIISNEHGQHLLITPKGEILQGTIKTVVTDNDGDYSTCTATTFCNIAKDETDAVLKYHEANKGATEAK